MKKTPIDSQVSSHPSVSSHRIFEDPVIARAAEEDPIVVFFAKWWRQLLVVVLALGALVYARSVFRENMRANQERAAEVFSRVREHYGAFRDVQDRLIAARENPAMSPAPDLKALEKRAAEARGALRQQLAILGDTEAPYTSIRHIYAGLAAIKEGDFETARDELSSLKKQELDAYTGEDRLYVELATFALAKALLDRKESQTEGVSLLKELAEKGQLLHATSALSLAKVAESPEEKRAALAILDAVKSREPEQAQLLEEETKRLRSEVADGSPAR